MKKARLSILIPAIVFVATELVLYALFLAEDFGGVYVGENVWIKYATVCLAFGCAAYFFFVSLFQKTDWIDALLLMAGLAFTLVSDMFLLVRGEHFEAGVATFICAQLCYFLRIGRTKLWWGASIALRIVLPAIVIIVLASVKMLDTLYILVAIYFVQLVMNCLENVVFAILVKDKLMIFVEAQSTWSINILVRILLYLAMTYQDYINEHRLNVYSTTKIELPIPEFYVIYTGDRQIKKDIITLKEDFFCNTGISIDLSAKVIYTENENDIIPVGTIVIVTKVVGAKLTVVPEKNKID